MSNWLVFTGTLLVFAGSVTVAVPDGSPLGRRGPDVLLPWTRAGTGAVRGRGPAPSRAGPVSNACHGLSVPCRHRAAVTSRRGDARDAAGRRLAGDPRRELYGRRTGHSRPGAPAVGVSRLGARSGALARQRGRPRRRPSRAARAAGGARRARARVGAPVVEHHRRRLSQSPAAAALHGGGAGDRDGPRRARARAAAASDPRRESVGLPAVRALDAGGGGVPHGARATDRLWPPVRRQQHPRDVREPRRRCRRIPRCAAGGGDRRDSPRRSRGQRRRRPADPDRRPRLAGGRAGLAPLRARAGALRRSADAGGVGHRGAAAAHAAGRGGPGGAPPRRGRPRGARCPRCVDCSATFPDFLANFPPCRHLAYLPDVARLEWAMNVALHAADATPLTTETARALSAGTLESARLALHPSVTLLASPWPVDALWRANQT